jgi:hypothetical protein
MSAGCLPLQRLPFWRGMGRWVARRGPRRALRAALARWGLLLAVTLVCSACVGPGLEPPGVGAPQSRGPSGTSATAPGMAPTVSAPPATGPMTGAAGSGAASPQASQPPTTPAAVGTPPATDAADMDGGTADAALPSLDDDADGGL